MADKVWKASLASILLFEYTTYDVCQCHVMSSRIFMICNSSNLVMCAQYLYKLVLFVGKIWSECINHCQLTANSEVRMRGNFEGHMH